MSRFNGCTFPCQLEHVHSTPFDLLLHSCRAVVKHARCLSVINCDSSIANRVVEVKIDLIWAHLGLSAGVGGVTRRTKKSAFSGDSISRPLTSSCFPDCSVSIYHTSTLFTMSKGKVCRLNSDPLPSESPPQHQTAISLHLLHFPLLALPSDVTDNFPNRFASPTLVVSTPAVFV